MPVSSYPTPVSSYPTPVSSYPTPVSVLEQTPGHVASLQGQQAPGVQAMGRSAYGMERAPGASVGHADNQSRMARNAEISAVHSTQYNAPVSSNRDLGQAPFDIGERFDRQNTMPFIPGAFPSSVQPT